MRRILLVVTILAMTFASVPAWADSGRPLDAALAAENETDGGDVGASGHAWVRLNQGQNQVCFAIEANGLTTPAVAAHIHKAPAGVNGGVVVNFDVANNGLSGCVEASKELIKDIRQSPWDYYVNVHNPTKPGGAVRGQLSK